MIDLRLGDCLEVLKTLPDNSVDSIVTDPPYGLSFMGKKWDYDVPSVEIWEECLRVLKPGGHLLSFGGSRTYHRMAVAIEDAGFEVRDQIMWVYGSGFPKSHNIGKAIQKQSGDVKVVGKKTGMGTTGNSYVSNNEEYIGGDKGVYKKEYDDIEINNQWEGWGTALKPAHEPICMARKPLSEKSIAENVLKHGTGGINIDGSRIGFGDEDINLDKKLPVQDGGTIYGNGNGFYRTEEISEYKEGGRFPANIMFDEEAGKLLDEQSGISKSQGGNSGVLNNNIYGKFNGEKNNNGTGFNDKGGASRFFYCPKVSKKERNAGLEDFELKEPQSLQFAKDGSFRENKTAKSGIQKRLPRANHHPTVKPIALMEYLIKLVTPNGGVVLEPFMGSGSTGIAAKNLGMSFIGIEREQEYFDIAKQRIGND